MFSSKFECQFNEEGYGTHFKIELILPVYVCLFYRDNEYNPTFKIKIENEECEILSIEQDNYSASITIELAKPVKIKNTSELELSLSILRSINADGEEEIDVYTDVWCFVGNVFIPTGPIVITKNLQELVRHDMFFQRWNDIHL